MTELSQASSSAQVGLVASPVTLSYAAEDHQFQLEVTNVSKIAYLLEYSSVNKDDKKIRQAVNKSGAANDQGVYSETILAGTQSGDDQFFHDVTEGKLEVIATHLNGERVKYSLTFNVDETGVLSLNSEATAPATQQEQEVMGTKTEATPKSTDALAETNQLLAQAQERHPAIQSSWYEQYLSQEMMMRAAPIVLLIGFSVLTVAGYGLWQGRRRFPDLSRRLV